MSVLIFISLSLLPSFSSTQSVLLFGPWYGCVLCIFMYFSFDLVSFFIIGSRDSHTYHSPVQLHTVQPRLTSNSVFLLFSKLAHAIPLTFKQSCFFCLFVFSVFILLINFSVVRVQHTNVVLHLWKSEDTRVDCHWRGSGRVTLRSPGLVGST